MKYSWIFIFLLIVLVVLNTIALFLFNWYGIKDLGFMAIIAFSVIFSSIPVIIWYFVSIISVRLRNNSTVSKNTLELYEFSSSTDYNIIVSSIGTVICSFTFLIISVMFSLGFVWFIVLSYLIPVFRLLVSVFQYFLFRKS